MLAAGTPHTTASMSASMLVYRNNGAQSQPTDVRFGTSTLSQLEAELAALAFEAVRGGSRT